VNESNQVDPHAVLSKGVYKPCYGLAFATVYAGCVVKEMLPADGMIVHGLQDGADAARRSWARSREEDEIARQEMGLPEEPAAAPARAAAHEEKSSHGSGA
jgi:hypothetical protein